MNNWRFACFCSHSYSQVIVSPIHRLFTGYSQSYSQKGIYFVDNRPKKVGEANRSLTFLSFFLRIPVSNSQLVSFSVVLVPSFSWRGNHFPRLYGSRALLIEKISCWWVYSRALRRSRAIVLFPPAANVRFLTAWFFGFRAIVLFPRA